MNVSKLNSWWKHCSLYDRQLVSGYLLENYDGETEIYLEATDEWWESLSDMQKKQVHDFLTKE